MDAVSAQHMLESARAAGAPFRVLFVDVELPFIGALQPSREESVILVEPAAAARPAIVAGWPVTGTMIGSPTPRMIQNALNPFWLRSRYFLHR